MPSYSVDSRSEAVRRLQHKTSRMLALAGHAPDSLEDWDPFADLDELHRDSLESIPETKEAPQIDLTRKGPSMIVRLAIPGARAEQISIEVRDGILVINGKDIEGYDDFSRAMALPTGIDIDKITAQTSKSGIDVEIPLPEEQPSASAPPNPLDKITRELLGETLELLRAIKDATDAGRRLGLNSAPFGVRSELFAHRLCQEGVDGIDGTTLTPLGEAVVDALPPFTETEREQLAERAEEALASIGSNAVPS
jgi:HSP20 family molecular chaperone IbpA